MRYSIKVKEWEEDDASKHRGEGQQQCERLARRGEQIKKAEEGKLQQIAVMPGVC